MKVFVIFLFFLGLYLITSALQKSSVGGNNKTNTPAAGVNQLAGQQPISQLYSEMFDMSGPWVEKFIYNHPEEPELKEPEKEKMSF